MTGLTKRMTPGRRKTFVFNYSQCHLKFSDFLSRLYSFAKKRVSFLLFFEKNSQRVKGDCVWFFTQKFCSIGLSLQAVQGNRTPGFSLED